MSLDITKEEVLELVAQKTIDLYYDEITNVMNKEARKLVEAKLSQLVEKEIRDFLKVELENIVSKVITPIDIWGEPTGKPTTIREQLAKRAQTFWTEKVDKNGNPTNYGGTERAQILVRTVAEEEFTRAIRDNSKVLVDEFKKVLTETTFKTVQERVNSLFAR